MVSEHWSFCIVFSFSFAVVTVWLVGFDFGLFVCFDTLAGHDLLGSNNPPASGSCVAKTTGMHLCTRFKLTIFYF